MNSFRVRLKQLREEHNFTQQDLAEHLLISIRQYRRYEKGDYEPNIETLIKLANYFNVSLDYLLGRSEDKSRYPRDY
ncbi:helix-turn-helix domain-containing protein [Shouchella patagoniensis]|uniref:helix-turn-helix domain-containing protein n=1 Tax=Shouchella patagoniensis TaxID=228576 RepID=UPI0009950CE3|nr:helix-turn-helix transcriptional regulator [Shouchella patagoniensis]